MEDSSHQRQKLPHSLCGFLVMAMLLLPATQAAASHRDSGESSVSTSGLGSRAVSSFPVPVLFGVDTAVVRPDFGEPRGGGTRTHEGQDFLAPEDTPIVSPTKAVVLRTGEGESAGKYVYTANPGGEVFRYMHLKRIANIRRGDRLEPGDFIGTVGDTGNAPDGVYHLHFEVRDGRNATDPFPRLTDAFTLKEKISFLDGIFSDIRDDEAYAEFLVASFPEDFSQAVAADYALPRAVKNALDDSTIGTTIALRAKLNALIATIPGLLPPTLREGDQGAAVALLQTYLIFADVPGSEALRASGATGYYGPLTTSAILAYQAAEDLPPTGQFDSATKAMLKSNIGK